MIKSKYSKRKRKKLKLGEYRQFGFHAMLKLDGETEADIVNDVVWDAIFDVVEKLGLVLGGGGDTRYVSMYLHPRGNFNNVDSEKIAEFVIATKALPWVTQVEVSDISDVWHVTEADMDKCDLWYEETKKRMGL